MADWTWIEPPTAVRKSCSSVAPTAEELATENLANECEAIATIAAKRRKGFLRATGPHGQFVVTGPQALEAAAIYAQKIGLHLNTHLTIHLERAGVADKDAMSVIGTFLRMARDGMAKRGQQIAWLFVRENGPGKGSHVHIMIHCPPCQARYFVLKQRGWMKRAAGNDKLPRGTMRTKRIGGQISRYSTHAALYGVNHTAVLDYVSKGSEATQGRIIGKRCGCSQNIGPSARLVYSPSFRIF